MRAVGRDAAGRGYKFFLAASYSFPKLKDQKPQQPHKEEEMAPLDFDFADVYDKGEKPEVNHGEVDEEELDYEPLCAGDNEEEDLAPELKKLSGPISETQQPHQEEEVEMAVNLARIPYEEWR